MEQTKSLTAPIPAPLHARVTEERLAADQSLGQYITQLLTEYYQMKENGGNTNMSNTRTMAFQISEELFQRLKRHLERESARTGRKVTQREFVLGLIEQALEDAEQQEQEASGPEGHTEGTGIPEDTQQEDGVEKGEADTSTPTNLTQTNG